MQLGILLLQEDSRYRLDAQQTRDILAITTAAEKPLSAASASCLAVVACLQPDQLQYLRMHRGPLSEGPPESGNAILKRSRKLAATRAAEGGGQLPTASPRTDDGPGLAFEDIGAAPLRLEDQASLRLNAAQAAEFVKALDSLLEMDRLEIEVAAKIRGVLRQEQVLHLAEARSQRETVRRMAPLRLLDYTLDRSASK